MQIVRCYPLEAQYRQNCLGQQAPPCHGRKVTVRAKNVSIEHLRLWPSFMTAAWTQPACGAWCLTRQLSTTTCINCSVFRGSSLRTKGVMHKQRLTCPKDTRFERGLLQPCSATAHMDVLGDSPHNQHQHQGGERDSHRHCHGDHPHGHDHDHDHYPDSWATRVMRRIGLVQLATRIEHSGPLAITSIACFLLSLLLSLPPLTALLSQRLAAPLSAAFLAGTYALSGLPQAVSSGALAASGQLDTHVLMAAAVAATLYLGMAQEGALLLLLFQVSHFLEAKGSLERLFAAMPELATLVGLAPGPQQGDSGRGGGGGPDLSSCREVLAASVRVGQLVLVRPGEQVPLDGDVVWGVASVSAAHISGEAAPARVAPGDWVPAGALSADGALVVRVTAAAEDSTPARIARMATEAQASKPRLQRLLDQIGTAWSRGVVAASLLSGLVLAAAGVPLMDAPGGAVYRALGVLVAGSPCAVVLVPLAYVCAMAAVTRRGVLLKGASALDALAACRTLALDKTGTLTTGQLRLTEATLLHWEQGQVTERGGEQQQQAGGPRGGDSGAWHPRQVSLMALLCAEESHQHDQHQEQQQQQPTPAMVEAADGDSFRSRPTSAPTEGPAPPAGTRGGDDAGTVEAEWGRLAAACAVALSRASSHPMSRAVAEAGGELDRGLGVSGFEQVPGAGVRGTCTTPDGREFAVTFGSTDFALTALSDHQQQRHGEGAATEAAVVARVRSFLSVGGGGSDAVKALSLLVVAPVVRNGVTQKGGEAAEGAAGGPSSANVAGGVGGGDPRVAVFCFEDVVRPGVVEAVAALQDGSWRRGGQRGGGGSGGGVEVAAARRVVMLTGDNPTVAAAVAGSVGIPTFHASMRPQDKLAFIQAHTSTVPQNSKLPPNDTANHHNHPSQTPPPAATVAINDRRKGGKGDAEAAANSAPAAGGKVGLDGWTNWWPGGGRGEGGGGRGGVLMMGDGINDAPALAAATVGVAVASSPRELVAAAADVIVLNGQGAAALPWLLRLADRTQSVVHQNLALALVSMAAATLPTLAGAFPLWLAVLLHEGSTLAVALNSLRLLLAEEEEAGPQGLVGQEGGRRRAGGGVRAALGEVWRGLCDLAASEPHGHHHHHHHHGHHHGHGHDHHDHHGHSHGHDHCEQQHGHGHDHHHHHAQHQGQSAVHVGGDASCCGRAGSSGTSNSHQGHHHDNNHHHHHHDDGDEHQHHKYNHNNNNHQNHDEHQQDAHCHDQDQGQKVHVSSSGANELNSGSGGAPTAAGRHANGSQANGITNGDHHNCQPQVLDSEPEAPNGPMSAARAAPVDAESLGGDGGVEESNGGAGEQTVVSAVLNREGRPATSRNVSASAMVLRRRRLRRTAAGLSDGSSTLGYTTSGGMSSSLAPSTAAPSSSSASLSSSALMSLAAAAAVSGPLLHCGCCSGGWGWRPRVSLPE